MGIPGILMPTASMTGIMAVVWGVVLANM